MDRLRRPIPLAVLIGVASWLLFVWRLGVPHQPVFDEVHYLPAARALLDLSGPTNIEHPLLAKELIALGMRLFGDNPFGWRIASTVAGAATVVAVFALVQAMTGRIRASLTAAVLGLAGGMILVQARIAMLDTFMAAFLVAAIACLAWAARRGGWGLWLAGAALLGAAVACKWAAAPYVAFAGLGYWWAKARRADLWPGLPRWSPPIVLGIVAVAVYLATFAPAFFYTREPLTVARVIPFHLEMYARQTQVLPPHTYQSDWWSWPLLIRPIWYIYERADGAQRGILLLGNPAVMWGGLVAVAACLWAWAGTRALAPLAAAAMWIASVGVFAVIPKSLGFYYYYYPSSILIVVAIAVAFDHWRETIDHWDEAFAIMAVTIAIYLYPIWTAQPLDRPDAFERYAWFRSWV